jgi:hypothetical protein
MAGHSQRRSRKQFRHALPMPAPATARPVVLRHRRAKTLGRPPMSILAGRGRRLPGFLPVVVLPGSTWTEPTRGLVFTEPARGNGWTEENRGLVWTEPLR